MTRALFLLSYRQPESAIEKWTSSLQAAGASVSQVRLWSGPGNVSRRQSGSACNVDAFLLGARATAESHLAQFCGGEELLIVSVDLEQQLLPRAGVVLLVWQPQVPKDIVASCVALPPGVADEGVVKGLLLVDASPSLTLSVTHKALEGAGLQALARKPTVLVSRTATAPQAAMQALMQLADPLSVGSVSPPDVYRGPGVVRIAVARDDAFGPCFHENLVLLQQSGAQLVFFSPLYDTSIPAGVTCIYLSSGPLEPERWQQLANNRPLLAAMRAFCEAGGLVLAEGAGLVYLSRTVDLDEDDGAHKHRVYDMAGVLPFKARLLPEPQTAAVQLRVTASNPLLSPGSQPRGYLCSQADLVLVEERPLLGLALSFAGGKGAGYVGKGVSSHLSTSYEVTVVRAAKGQSDGSVAGQAGAPQVASEPDSPPAHLPEGYTVHKVLASSCFVYLPSEPGLAAHLVRQCALLDVAGLAAGMAHHHMGSSLAAKSNLSSAVGSRAGSRRQSIQDVSALMAAFGSNGGNCAGSCAPNCHHHHHLHTTSAPALPPRGPSFASSDCGGGTTTATASCVASPRQPPCQLSHSNSGATLSSGSALPPKAFACEAASGRATMECGGSSVGDRVLHAGCSAAGHAASRGSLDAPPGLLAAEPVGPLLHRQHVPCSGLATARAASPASCSEPHHVAGVGGAASPAAGAVMAGVDSPGPTYSSPLRGASPAVVSMTGRNGSGIERSSSCSSSAALDTTGRSRGSMYHTASAGVLPAYGYTGGVDAQDYSGLRRGPQDDLAYAHYGGGGGHWMTSAGQLPWSPGLPSANLRGHCAAGLLGPRAAAGGASGPGGIVCCAPGACEALVAMGLANGLSGIGFDCDHPPDVCASRPVVIRWVPVEEAPQGAAARGIRVVRPGVGGGGGGGAGFAVGGGAATAGESGSSCARGGRASVERCRRVLLVDELALRREPPAALVLPDTADLSDVELAQMEQALVETGMASFGGDPSGPCTLLRSSCRTLVDVLDLMLELGAVAGEPQAASMLLERLQARLRRVMAAAATAAGQAGPLASPLPMPVSPPRPRRVLVLQSLQPLVEPGRWVPEMLATVGATACLARPGGPDVALSWSDIRQRAAPDVLIILTPPVDPAGARTAPASSSSGPPGNSAAAAKAADGAGGLAEQLAALAAQPGWWCLPAVRVSQVYLMQSALAVRPGPRLVDGVELLARVLLPGHYASSRKVPAGAVMRLSLAAGQRCRATLLARHFEPMAFG